MKLLNKCASKLNVVMALAATVYLAASGMFLYAGLGLVTTGVFAYKAYKLSMKQAPKTVASSAKSYTVEDAKDLGLNNTKENTQQKTVEATVTTKKEETLER